MMSVRDRVESEMNRVRCSTFNRYRSIVCTVVSFLPLRLRPIALRAAAVKADLTSRVSPRLVVRGRSQVVIGKSSYLNYGCYLDAEAPIEVGVRVHIGDHVRLITSTHEMGKSECRAGVRVDRPIRVRDGVWIGSGAVLLPGVLVGQGCVIAAGSVVVEDCMDDCLYAGVPARLVRKLG